MHGTAVGDEPPTSAHAHTPPPPPPPHMSHGGGARTGTRPDTATRLDDDVDAARDLGELCERVHRRVYDFLHQAPRDERAARVQRVARESLAVIAEALERYTLDQLSFSYNGGKDCLVLLILYLAALHTHQTSSPAGRGRLPARLQSVYIVSADPFPAVTSFVAASAARYRLGLASYAGGAGGDMRGAFAAYLADAPQVAAVLVGTRRTDPHGARLSHFDPTDAGWPRFVRVHPVIDWRYADIWRFIRDLRLRYCELYDRGYTSLGGALDTHPNPALAVAAAEPALVYRPAYELVDDGAERLGRHH